MRNFIKILLPCTTLILVFFGTGIMAGEIRGRIHGAEGRMLYLYEMFQDENRLLDSTRVNSDGTLFFSERHYPAGFYFLRIEAGPQIDMVIVEEGVDFATHMNSIIDSMLVKKSEETKAFYALLRISQYYKSVANELRRLKEDYLRDEPEAGFVRQIESEIGYLSEKCSLRKKSYLRLSQFPGCNASEDQRNTEAE